MPYLNTIYLLYIYRRISAHYNTTHYISHHTQKNARTGSYYMRAYICLQLSARYLMRNKMPALRSCTIFATFSRINKKWQANTRGIMRRTLRDQFNQFNQPVQNSATYTRETPCDLCTIIVRYIASIVCFASECHAKKSAEIFATFYPRHNEKSVTKKTCYIGVLPSSGGPPAAPKGVRIFVKKTEGGG